MSIPTDRLREIANHDGAGLHPLFASDVRAIATELLACHHIVEAAKEVARVARTAPPGFDDDGNPETLWQTPALQDAVEKLVKAVEGKP